MSAGRRGSLVAIVALAIAGAVLFGPLAYRAAQSARPTRPAGEPVVQTAATRLKVIWPRDQTWPSPLRAVVRRGTLRLSDLRGRRFVLNFFASWCDACRREVGLLAAAARQRHRIVFLAAAVNDLSPDAKRFLRLHRVPFPAVAAGSQIVRGFGLVGLPDTFFVDAGGRVKMTRIGALTPASLVRGLGRLGN
jgi:cytochrome c biogenesis protein CcmG/thiol:disulfide interchange protein DsbE